MRFPIATARVPLVLTPLVAQKKPVTDDIINDQVRVKLASDSEIGGMAIDVDVHEGVGALKGKVRNRTRCGPRRKRSPRR